MRAYMYIELSPVSHALSRSKLDLIVLIAFLMTP